MGTLSHTIRRARAASLLVAAVALAACGSSHADASGDFPEAAYVTVSSDAKLTIEVRTAPSQPPGRGTARVELRIVDADGEARDGLTLEVTPWMPSHGHGAPGTPVVTALGDGVYRVDGLELTMAGTWELRIAISGPDGFEDHAVARLEVH